MKKTIIKIIIQITIIIIAVSSTALYYESKLEKVSKESYWAGVQNQFEEERYLDSKENSTKGSNLPSQEVSKSKLLNDLAQLESLNGKKRKVLDTNNRYSLGLYHWQAHSVQDAYKRYYGKKISLKEAIKIAEDDKLATQLTHDAIFVKKELYHWRISLCKLGMITKGCLTQDQINKLVLK